MFHTYTKDRKYVCRIISTVKLICSPFRFFRVGVRGLKSRGPTFSFCILLTLYLTGCFGTRHPIPDELPPLVTPGDAWYVSPPSDAFILFDGSHLDHWQRKRGKAAKWHYTANYLEATPWKGAIWTRSAFGDIQLHIEWAAPLPAKKKGQRRGNSGVKLMGLYEIQILDSFENDTYPVGQAGAVYGQHPPLVNGSKQTGMWQSYDIIFRRPRFRADGSLVTPAYVSVFHNGILVQDHVEITGPTKGKHRAYKPHPDRLPLMLQYHGSRVRFRNIWIRELEAVQVLEQPG